MRARSKVRFSSKGSGDITYPTFLLQLGRFLKGTPVSRENRFLPAGWLAGALSGRQPESPNPFCRSTVHKQQGVSSVAVLLIMPSIHSRTADHVPRLSVTILSGHFSRSSVAALPTTSPRPDTVALLRIYPRLGSLPVACRPVDPCLPVLLTYAPNVAYGAT